MTRLSAAMRGLQDLLLVASAASSYFTAWSVLVVGMLSSTADPSALSAAAECDFSGKSHIKYIYGRFR
jgi:hypothetical protein